MMNLGVILGSDIYLPAMRGIATAFHGDVAQVGLSSYVFGLAMSQPLFGHLSDRLGAKIAATAGASVTILASVGCVLVGRPWLLIVLRCVEGIGEGSGLVIVRAMVGRTLQPAEAARLMAGIGVLVGLSPTIFPAIGTVLDSHFGWKGTFVFTAGFSAVVCVILMSAPCFNIAPDRRSAHRLRAVATVIRHRPLWLYGTMALFCYTAYYAYLSVAPFIFARIGLRTNLGILCLNLSVMYALGGASARWMLRRYEVSGVIKAGAMIACTGCVVASVGRLNGYTLFALLMASSLLSLANGFLLPIGGGCVAAHYGAKFPGAAAGAYSFVQMTFASVGTALAGLVTGRTMSGLATLVAAVGFGGVVLQTAFAGRGYDNILRLTPEPAAQ